MDEQHETTRRTGWTGGRRPLRRGEVVRALVRPLPGQRLRHRAKVRPVVVWRVCGTHVHVVPLTTGLRPRRLSRVVPGADRAASVWDRLVEVARDDVEDLPPVTVLAVGDVRRVERWLDDGTITADAPRWCRPVPAPRRDTTVRADRVVELLGPPPTTVGADEALARLTARRQALVATTPVRPAAHDDLVAAA